MFYTQNERVNQSIDRIHALIQTLIHPLIITEQVGFKAINYGQTKGMKSVLVYIIVYDQKANLGFPQGVRLQRQFPFLKGTGKTHRHIEIDEALSLEMVKPLIQAVLNLKTT